MSANAFTTTTKENSLFNQYWYSPATIATITQEVEEEQKKRGNEEKARIGCVSTPSIYFSLPDRSNCFLFDYDTQWNKDVGYVKYDYAHPDDIPANLLNTFDFVIVDPPFITEQVWNNYAKTIHALLKPNGKIIATTIQENASLMERLFNAKPQRYLPSVPHLVYQYFLYANYSSEALAKQNAEIVD